MKFNQLIEGSKASPDDWIAYWKVDGGSYKTKVIDHPGDTIKVVEALYKKHNTFFNVGVMKRSDWARLKSSLP